MNAHYVPVGFLCVCEWDKCHQEHETENEIATGDIRTRDVLDRVIKESLNKIWAESWTVRKMYRKYKKQVREAERTVNALRIFERKKENQW